MEVKNKLFEKKHASVVIEEQLKSTTYNETVELIEKLRELQIKMDHFVLDAYGWTDIQLQHGFYDLEYLPENDRCRFTIHPYARKEILKRLLTLNTQLHAAEITNIANSENQNRKKGNRLKGNTSDELF